MEEPPEEACHAEVGELNPLVGELCWVDAEVAQNEGWDNHCSEETYIPGIDAMVNIGLVLLQESVSYSPTYDAKNAINVG